MTDHPVRVQLSRRSGWRILETKGKDERIPDGTGLSASGPSPRSRPLRASIPCAVPLCHGCGVGLTGEEVEFYGTSCDACEKAWSDAMSKWCIGDDDER